jgi:ADP-heptose:LPS heptosyltransferase
MQMTKIGSQPIQRIVILRALQLGDLMCSIPALRALRMAFPSAEISLIGLPWAHSFVQRFHSYIDSLIEFPGFPGFPEQDPDIQRLPEFLKEVQNCQFDLALQMQGSGGISNPLVMLFGAKTTAGYYLPGQYCPEGHPYLAYPVQEPEVRRHLLLMDFLGIPLQGEELEFPLCRRTGMK